MASFNSKLKVFSPDESFREIAQKNREVAEKIAKRQKPVCPHCGKQIVKKAGMTNAKYSNARQKWKCSNPKCGRTMTEDDRRYGNVATESMLWQQAALAVINDPSGGTLRAIAKKADGIGDAYFFNWQNSTARRFFKGVVVNTDGK